MSISTPPTAPSRSNPSTFSTLADAFLSWLSTTFVTELNATIAAMNTNDTISASTSSVAIGTGSKSFTVDTGKSYQVGMSVKIAYDSSNWMHGEVTSYNSGTGALVVNVTLVSGSGTQASWTITLSGPSLGLTTFITTLLDDANAAAALTTLGVSAFVQTLLDDADAAAALATLGASPEPWMIDIDIFNTPGAQTNFSTSGSSTNFATFGYLTSSGAQNAEISWPVVLSAGTWTFSMMHATDTNRGIYSVQLDTVEKGTIDGYAGAAYNVLSTVPNISITTPGKKTLTLKMATKNGSSSSYIGTIQHVRLIRTA